jgi:predicted amidohydrolase YtcJ
VEPLRGQLGRSRRLSLLLRNAVVRGERTSVLIDGERIAAVGGDHAADETIGLGGAELLPGFVDTHTHLGWAGRALFRVDWSDGPSLDEVRRARRYTGTAFWLLGGGFDSNAELPSQVELDDASDGAPAFLVSADQSVALVNSRASDLMHLYESLVVPDDGRLYGGDARGMPTALVVPPPGRHRLRAELAAALAELPRHGITEAHDIATFPGEPEPPEVFWERSYTEATLFSELELPVRIQIRPSLHRRHEFLGDSRIHGLKLFAQGGSGRRPGVTFRYPGREVATAWIQEAHDARIPVSVHSLRAHDVEETLSVFEGVSNVTAVRHRLVHAYDLAPGHVERIARLGLTVEAQPVGNDSEGIRGPWRELLDAGVPVEFSSDWRDASFAELDPLRGVQIAVAHGLTRDEALRCYSRGTVQAGARADLVALDEDGVVLTICAGSETYRRR